MSAVLITKQKIDPKNVIETELCSHEGFHILADDDGKWISKFAWCGTCGAISLADPFMQLPKREWELPKMVQAAQRFADIGIVQGKDAAPVEELTNAEKWRLYCEFVLKTWALVPVSVVTGMVGELNGIARSLWCQIRDNRKITKQEIEDIIRANAR